MIFLMSKCPNSREPNERAWRDQNPRPSESKSRRAPEFSSTILKRLSNLLI